SDGASGSLDDRRLADILSTGSPDFAAVELVRASLEGGSTDHVNCIVAAVVPVPADAPADAPADPPADLATGSDGAAPLVVGAAAELKSRARKSTSLLRRH